MKMGKMRKKSGGRKVVHKLRVEAHILHTKWLAWDLATVDRSGDADFFCLKL